MSTAPAILRDLPRFVEATGSLAADPAAAGAKGSEAPKRQARNREGGADVKNNRDKNKKR